MFSPYRISANNTKKRSKKALNTKFDDDSRHKADVKRPQMTSNDLKRLQLTLNENSKKTKTKNNSKVGSIQENNEVNVYYLDKILKNNDSEMELAMQITSNDKTVRMDTIQDLKEFNQQTSTTQAKKGEQLGSMMPAIKKAFNLMGDNIVELSVENESLNNQIGHYDEKWLQESKVKLLKENDDEKRADLLMSRMI